MKPARKVNGSEKKDEPPRRDHPSGQDSDTGFGQQKLDVVAVAARLGVSTRTVRRLVAQSLLPPPIKIGKCARWFLDDVINYERSLIIERSKVIKIAAQV